MEQDLKFMTCEDFMKVSVPAMALSETYIGHMEVTETDIDWYPQLRWSEFRDFGDMVYFMFVYGELMKIGKAAGKSGWNGRVGMYKNGIKGDKTNERILRIMKEIQRSKIDIYAIQAPREKMSFTNPLTGDIIETEIETARDIELDLTRQYLNESSHNQLLFSNQLL